MTEPLVPLYGAVMSEFTLSLSSGEVGILGYGSLFSRESLERTLGRSYTGPMFECLLPGWRRGWDIAMPNSRFFTLIANGREYPERIIYLNVRPNRGSLLNGVLFVVTPADLAALDAREWIYSRTDVTGSITNGSIAGGRVFMYVGLDKYLLSAVPESVAKASVRKTYLQIVESGLNSLDGGFRHRYRDSTDRPPEHLIIDDCVDPGEPVCSEAATEEVRRLL
ncbi:MAG: gamma-glutamylcyclotransferase [Planctomycetes bacterium]|nr:gamma-glutamylcyclotransferase [Planctomycetota bacterium]